PALWSIAALGLVTAACHALTTGLVLLRARGGLRDAEAHTLFAFLGMATFPVAVALGFLVYWCDDPALALERVAVFIAVAGVPVLATGVLIHSSSEPEPQPEPVPETTSGAGSGWGSGGLTGPIRTIGTGIALAGMLVLLAA